MFSGIVEATEPVITVLRDLGNLRLNIKKPSFFNDLGVGDSICVNGVCLTIENFDSESMEFVAAAETLQITKWTADFLQKRPVNLERSLQLGARIHGHLVSGHVDDVSYVIEKEELEGATIFHFSLPKKSGEFIWKKGSVAVNGVSLTVNDVTEESFSVCLIPETLRRTNLALLNVEDVVNIESDYLVKGLTSAQNLKQYLKQSSYENDGVVYGQ